jgi:hypothetical protein
MQHNPEVVLADFQHRANLLAFDAVHFPKVKNCADVLR